LKQLSAFAITLIIDEKDEKREIDEPRMFLARCLVTFRQNTSSYYLGSRMDPRRILTLTVSLFLIALTPMMTSAQM
jgi:hypothetical protein